MKKVYTLVLLAAASLSTSCVTHKEGDALRTSGTEPLTFITPPASPGATRSVKAYPDIWARIRQNTGIYFQFDEPRIVEQRDKYLKHAYFLEQVSGKAIPYAHYIVNEIARRQMPSELALLPFVESSFNVEATSPLGAAGLWQFMPGTAEHLKMKTNPLYDARRDVVASTEAALDYLQWLNKKLDNDWLLTLAAYNAGLGTVRKSIEANEKKNKPTDFWNLSLPEETRDYVPHLLALQSLIDAPEAYGIKLANIPDKPYFAMIRSEAPLDLVKVAAYLNLDANELRQLNAGYRIGKTTGSSHARLLIPVKPAVGLTDEKLVELQQVAMTKTTPARYKVKPGDTLSEISHALEVPETTLRQLNGLNSSKIKAGQELLLTEASS